MSSMSSAAIVSAAGGATAASNVSVSVRVRPLNERERAGTAAVVFKPLAGYAGHLLYEDGAKTQTYAYDHVFDDASSTRHMFDSVARDLVRGVVEGYNGTMFAYGQTAAGKTYTMLGNKDNPGILPLAVNEIMAAIGHTPHRAFLIRCSYIEIYNEVVTDLLSADGKTTLAIREHPQRGFFVEAAEEVISTADDIMACLARGEKHRHVGTTDMNKRSSRSHTLFRIVVESRPTGEADGEARASEAFSGGIMMGTLNLVDLAGSESVRTTNAVGERQREAGNINKSLLCLSRVIKELARNSSGGKDGPQGHTSFRDSKLTRVLQPSLAGNTRLAVVCCISPSREFVDETRSTLLFASSAKDIKLECKVNEVMDDNAKLRRLEKELQETRKQLEMLKTGPVVVEPTASSAAASAAAPAATVEAVMDAEAPVSATAAAVVVSAAAPPAVAIAQTVLMQQYEKTIAQLRAQIFVGGAPAVSAEVSASAFESLAEARGKSQKESARLAAKGRAKRHRETWCPSGADAAPSVDFLALLKPKAKASAATAAAPAMEDATMPAVAEADADESMSGDEGGELDAAAAAPVSQDAAGTQDDDDDDVISFRPRAVTKVARMHDSIDAPAAAAASAAELPQEVIPAPSLPAPAATASPAPRNSPRDRELVRLRSMVNRLEHTCSDKEDELNSLRSDLEFATQVNENTEGMIDSMREEARLIKAQQAELMAQRVMDAATIAALQGQLQAAQATHIALQQQCDDAAAESMQVRAAAAVEVQALEAQVAHAVAASQVSSDDAAQLRLQLTAAHEECTSALEQVAASDAKAVEAGAAAAALQTRVDDLEKNLAVERVQVEQLVQAVSDRDASVANLVKQLQDVREDATNAARDAREAAVHAARDMDATAAREEAIRKRAEGAEAQLLTLQSAASSSASERDAATAELSLQLSALRDTLSQCEMELAECRVARDDAQSAALERDAETTTVRAALTDMQDAYDMASMQLQQSQAQHDEQVAALQAQVAAATAAHDAAVEFHAADKARAGADMSSLRTTLAHQASLLGAAHAGLQTIAAAASVAPVELTTADATQEWTSCVADAVTAACASSRALQAELEAHMNTAEQTCAAASARIDELQATVQSQHASIDSTTTSHAQLVAAVRANCALLCTALDSAPPAQDADPAASLTVATASITDAFQQLLSASHQAAAEQERLAQCVANLGGFIARLGVCDTADIDSVATIIVDAEGMLSDVPADVGTALQSTCVWLRELHEAKRAGEEAADARVADAVARADELTQNNEGLNAQLGELQAAVVTLTAARDELRMSLDAGGSDASARLELISQLQVALSTQQTRVAALTAELEQHALALRERDAEIAAAAHAYAALQADVDAARAELHDACTREAAERDRANRLSQVEMQLSSFEAAAAEARGLAHSADAARQLMADQVVQKELEITLLHSDLDAAEQRESDLTTHLTDSRAQQQRLQDATSRLTMELADKSAALKGALDSLASTQASRDTFERSSAEATTQAAEADARARSALNDAAALRSKLAEAVQREEHLRLECASLEATSGRFASQAEATHRRVIDLEARVATQEEALRSATSTAAATEAQLKARAEQTLSTVADELRRTRAQLTHAETQLSDMSDSLLDMKAEMGNKTTQYEVASAELSGLRDSYDALLARFGELRDAATGALHERNAADASRASALAELQSCEARLETVSSQLVRAMEDNARLQDRVAKLDATKLTDAQVKKMLQIKEANQKYKVLVPQLQARVTQLEAAASTSASAGSSRGEAATKLAEALAAAQADAAKEAVRTAAVQTCLEAELDEARHASDAMRTALAEARGELDHVRGTYASQQTLVDSLQRDSGRMSGACAALRSTLRALSESDGVADVTDSTPLYELVSMASGLLASTVARTRSAEATLQQLSSQHEAAAAQLHARCQQLQTSSTAAQAELESKSAVVAGLQSQVEHLKEQLMTAMDRHAELQQVLDDTTEKLASLELASGAASNKLALTVREAAIAAEEHTRSVAMLEKENLALMLELRTLRTAAATAAARMSVSSGRASTAATTTLPAQPAPVNSAAPVKPIIGRASIIRANMTALPPPRNSVAKREPLGAISASASNALSNVPTAVVAPVPAVQCIPAADACGVASMDLESFATSVKTAPAATSTVDVFAHAVARLPLLLQQLQEQIRRCRTCPNASSNSGRPESTRDLCVCCMWYASGCR